MIDLRFHNTIKKTLYHVKIIVPAERIRLQIFGHVIALCYLCGDWILDHPCVGIQIFGRSQKLMACGLDAHISESGYLGRKQKQSMIKFICLVERGGQRARRIAEHIAVVAETFKSGNSHIHTLFKTGYAEIWIPTGAFYKFLVFQHYSRQHCGPEFHIAGHFMVFRLNVVLVGRGFGQRKIYRRYGIRHFIGLFAFSHYDPFYLIVIAESAHKFAGRKCRMDSVSCQRRKLAKSSVVTRQTKYHQQCVYINLVADSGAGSILNSLLVSR